MDVFLGTRLADGDGKLTVSVSLSRKINLPWSLSCILNQCLFQFLMSVNLLSAEWINECSLWLVVLWIVVACITAMRVC